MAINLTTSSLGKSDPGTYLPYLSSAALGGLDSILRKINPYAKRHSLRSEPYNVTSHHSRQRKVGEKLVKSGNDDT